MKLIGLVLVVSSASGFGMYLARRLKEKAYSTQLIIDFLKQFILEISAVKTTPRVCVKHIYKLEKYHSNAFLRNLVECMEKQESFFDGMNSAVKNTGELMDMQVSKCLEPLAQVVGAKDLETQKLVVDSVITQLEQYQKSQQMDSDEKGGLYIKLSAFGGLFIGILLF